VLLEHWHCCAAVADFPKQPLDASDDMPAIEFFKPPVSDLALFNADWNPAVLSVSSAVSLAIWHWMTCQSKPDFPFTLAKK
jgi:hypothetical protein